LERKARAERIARPSSARCKPLDGVNVWDTLPQGKASTRSEIINNVEPFRGALVALGVLTI
jgi:hypothetical protein